MKIAVKVNNWIGDVIMNLPALEALRRQYPDAEIVAIARPWVAEIFQFRPDLIDRCIDFDDRGDVIGSLGFLKFCRQLRRERFDLAVVFTKHIKGALMMALAGVPKRIGLKTRETRLFLNAGVGYASLPRSNRHQSQNFLDVLYFGLGITAAPNCKPQLMSPQTQMDSALARLMPDLTRPLLCVHAGAAYGTAKRWSQERYAVIIARFLKEKKGTVILLGVIAEKEVNQSIVDTVNHPRLKNLCGQTKLAESLLFIAASDLFLSNDSGLMHAASAFGVAQVAIFGPTDVKATFPNNPKAETVNHPVACSPCFERHCPIGHDCMIGVKIPMVWTAMEKALEQKR